MDADIRVYPRDNTLHGGYGPCKKRSAKLLEVIQPITELLFLGAVVIDLGTRWVVPGLRHWAAEVVVECPIYNEYRRTVREPNLAERNAETGTGGGEGESGIDLPNVGEECSGLCRVPPHKVEEKWIRACRKGPQASFTVWQQREGDSQPSEKG